MSIQIHDTLTGKKRELVPLEPGKVRFYCCGPTVYDHAHVGYARSYDEDMDALGNLRPDVAPRVSDHIPHIVRMIGTLVAKGYAYAASNGDVYYRVRKFPEYGRLAKRNLDDLLSGARVEVGEAKEDALDFALWKAAKPGEPAWESPWGKGRPGWHIECSAMAAEHLGT